jgi:Zn-dependent protease with chaperone function
MSLPFPVEKRILLPHTALDRDDRPVLFSRDGVEGRETMTTLAFHDAGRDAEQARRYQRARRRFRLAGWLAGTGLLLLLLATGWSEGLRELSFAVSGRAPLALAVYVLLFGALFEVLRLPLEFSSDYRLEHRYGLSRMTLGAWVKDRLKGLALAAALSLAAAELLYGALERFPKTWWIWTAAAGIVFMAALAKLAPVILFPLFFRFEPLRDEGLERRLLALAARAGTPAVSVRVWKLGEKSRKGNAALVGWGKTRRILLSDTLLGEHSPEEIETILAHELAHHVHGDIGKGMAIEAGFIVLTVYLVSRALVWATPRFGFAGPADFANLPLVLLVAGLAGLALRPALNAYSRRREWRADEFALRMTRDPAAFIGAMRKLAGQNLAEVAPHPVIEFLFSSHPAIGKRIAFAERIEL